MNDSPVNFMLYGHTSSFQLSLESKSALLKAELFELMSSLNSRKEQNLIYLREMDNQQEVINSLRFEIEYQNRKRQDMVKQRQSKHLQSPHQHTAEHIAKYRATCKSTEIPNKHVYLDTNNNSIESSSDNPISDKKAKIDIRLKLTSASNLKDKKSQSLARFKFK